MMQRRLSAFKDYTIEAPDGKVGYVCDILVNDDDWKLRWFVINAGSWLFGRQLLIRPEALGRPDIRQRAFPVTLTKAEVQANPDISSDQPVFRQMEQNLSPYDSYGSMWSVGDYNSFAFGSSDGMTPNTMARQHQHDAPAGDPHLRSMGQVVGYHIHALDGDVGHLDDFLVDDETWQIEYAIVDTKNWGSGKHVLVPATEVKSVDWAGRYIQIDQTRYNLKCRPSWQEPDWSDRPIG
jgi:hypothetical protein